MEKITDVLKLVDLDEKEIEIYTNLLRLKEATASKVATVSKIERTLAYYIIEKLINKGLVSYNLKNNVKYYSASNPEKIIDDLKYKEEEIKKIIPYLKNLQGEHIEEMKVEIYKGKEGMKAIINDMFKIGKEFLVFGEQGQAMNNFPIIYKQYLKRLIKTGIKERVLVREDLRNKIEKSKNSKFRYLPKELLSPTTTLVYDNKVQITLWEKPMFNILITSKKVADSYKAYFEHFWKIAKR